MATLLLSAAGAALGGAAGGSILGLSGAVIGRAVGATLGQAIDQRLMGAGAQVVETGRARSLRFMNGKEGSPIPRIFGAMRVTGQVIWSTNFRETATTTGSGKGLAPAGPTVRNYSYSISFAVGLCEGVVSRIGRIWADGRELKQKGLTIRLHKGTEDQVPDPLIEAVEGEGTAPACRGTAYLVFEDLDLTPFGNRIPQISAEVFRPAGEQHLSEMIRAVALVPGTGEYALATENVRFTYGKGKVRSANVHGTSRRPDFVEAVRQLDGDLPNCDHASLVVSWFGDDLRADRCTIAPRVEQKDTEASQPWRSGGVTRSAARLVSQAEGRPQFGGTPDDLSVIQAIRHLNGQGRKVMFYPFVLMDIPQGNGLTDPWTGAEDQPALPWRGRITLSVAPGRPGSLDKTAFAADEVAAFFGAAEPGDFGTDGDSVTYAGPAGDWGYRRFVLHYARLCALAGGVDCFALGSELRGLTQVRSGPAIYPAVAALKQLAADVRSILGPAVKLTYAADWSEYFGHHPQDGSGDVFFHLDPLWSDPEIDLIGIDNYLPLSDWRNAAGHADEAWGRVANPDYLRANVEGGEYYDWYYESRARRDLQQRTPITDGAYGETWVWRTKDIRNWWLNAHHNRPGGIRETVPTAWVPQSKPVVFTEIGFPAVSNAANQPNMFVDAKSSESGLPYYSDGGVDEEIQHAGLKALIGYWTDPANNPLSTVSGLPMIDMARAHVWCWDTRPWPEFPALGGLWSDAVNHATGHWLNGRAAHVPLADVVAEIAGSAGAAAMTGGLAGMVSGYEIGAIESARASIQPLALTYGFDAGEGTGALEFRMRGGPVTAILDAGHLAEDENLQGFERTRLPPDEDPGRIRLEYVRADAAYQDGAEEVADPAHPNAAVAVTGFALALRPEEARATATRWIGEAAAARDRLNLVLPPSATGLVPGDVLAVDLPGSRFLGRIDRIEDTGLRHADLVRVEPGIYRRTPVRREPGTALPADRAEGMAAEFLDLPLPDLGEAPRIAVTADPWPGGAAVYGSAGGDGFSLAVVVERGSVSGTVLEDCAGAEPDIWARNGLRLQVAGGVLTGRTEGEVLNGANVAAVRVPGGTDWEIIQFAGAELTGPDEYLLSGLLRGQAGTGFLGRADLPAGSDFVLLDGTAATLPLGDALRGQPRLYRAGPSGDSYDEPSFSEHVWTWRNVALRPHAPVHLKARTDGAGGVNLTWIRCTREDGDSWEGREVPLGEASEAYQVVVNGGLRTEEVAGPSFAYSAAARLADGTTGAFTVDIAQISEKFGTGPFSRIVIDG